VATCHSPQSELTIYFSALLLRLRCPLYITPYDSNTPRSARVPHRLQVPTAKAGIRCSGPNTRTERRDLAISARKPASEVPVGFIGKFRSGPADADLRLSYGHVTHLSRRLPSRAGWNQGREHGIKRERGAHPLVARLAPTK